MENQSISVRCCTRAPAPASARRSCGKRPSASAATHSARSSTKSAISLSSRSNPSKRWRGAWLIGLAISVALLAWVLYKIDPRKVWADAQHANGWLLLLTVFVATLTFPVRAIRWRSILREGNGQPFPFMPLWHAMTIGFMANNLLPARAGEFARAYVASRQLPVRFTTALASIGVERVFDALVMLALMAVAIAAPSFPAHTTLLGAPLSRLAGRTAVLFGALFVVAFAVVLRPAPWLAERLAGIAEGLVAGLEVLKRPGRFAAVLFWSLVLWLTNAASFAVCFRAFGLHLPLEGSLLLQGILGFAVALPASAGFFGVFEKGAQLTLQIYGISPSLALAYAVAYHLSTDRKSVV